MLTAALVRTTSGDPLNVALSWKAVPPETPAPTVTPAELGRAADPVELGVELGELGLGGSTGVGVLRTGGRRLHRQVTHTAEDRVHLVHRAFSGLHDRDAVLSVADGDLEATDLRPQALGDAQAGGVVGGPVDADARGQRLEALRHLPVRHREVPVGVHGRDVLVDTETH
jgi:hypothetical protein